MLTVIKGQTLCITHGSRWENGYNESFNGKLRDELFNGEIFYILQETQILIKRWKQHYNTIRPHSSLGYKPSASETVLPRPDGLSYTQFRFAHQGDHNRQALTEMAHHLIGAGHRHEHVWQYARRHQLSRAGRKRAGINAGRNGRELVWGVWRKS